MTRSGWIANVERCNYLDDTVGAGKQVYNLNLVRPWSEAEKQDDLRAPIMPNVEATLGDLMYPWRWLNTRWTAWGYLPTGTAADPTPRWEKIPATFAFGTEAAGGWPDADRLVARVRAELRTELGEQTAACEHPFSRAVDDYWGRAADDAAVNARSHVHAIAPLTHWPCVMSGPLMGLTGFMCVAEAELAGMTLVACFPEFDLQAGDPASPVPVTIAGSPVAPPSAMPGKGFNTMCAYNRPDIAFLGLAALIDPTSVEMKAAPLTSSQGLVSKGALQSAVVGHLLPLRLLSTLVASLVDGRTAKDAPAPLSEQTLWPAMRDALWKALGIGAERNPQGGDAIARVWQGWR